MLCNPQLYGVPIDALDTDPLLQVGAPHFIPGRYILNLKIWFLV